MNIEKIKIWFLSERPQYISLLSLISLTCCYMTLKPLEPQVDVCLRVFFSTICYIASLMQIDSKKRLEKVFNKYWHKLLVFILEIYTVIAFVGIYYIYSSAIYIFPYSKLVYAIMSFVWIRPIVLFFLSIILKVSDTIILSEHSGSWKIRITLIVLLMIPCILFLIAFNPAITSSDSEFCFAQAHIIGQAGVMTEDWQPPFYIAVLSLLIKVCDSVYFIIIFQCLAWAIVFVDGILFLYECGFSKRAVSITYLFIGLGFSNILQLVTLWKDIPYMTSLMWMTILLIKYILRTERFKKSLGWYIQFAFSVIFTGLIRQNGILAAIAIIILMPIVAKFSRKMIIVCFSSLMLIALIKGPIYHALNIVEVPQLKFFSMANDILFSYYTGHELSDDAMEMVSRITENDPDNYAYNPWWVAYNPAEPCNYKIGNFLVVYCKNFIQNPRATINALATRNSVIWSIVRPKDERPSCVNYQGEQNTYNPPIYPYRIENGLTSLLKNVCDKLTSFSIVYIFSWRAGIYNWLMIMLGVAIVCVKKRERIISLIPFVPIAASLGALFISSGWSDYRYVWPSMAISLFLLYYSILILKEKYVEEKTERRNSEKLLLEEFE